MVFLKFHFNTPLVFEKTLKSFFSKENRLSNNLAGKVA